MTTRQLLTRVSAALAAAVLALGCPSPSAAAAKGGAETPRWGAPAAGYDVATDIVPGYGYWVKSSGAGRR